MIRTEQIKTQAILDEAHRIRKKVFVEEQACPEEIEWEYEEESTHYIAFMNEIPAGTARWRETEKGIKLERFAVLKEFRGKKAGETLMHHILNDVYVFNKTIYLHAQITAVPFYLKLHFEPAGENFWEADIEHVKMTWKG